MKNLETSQKDGAGLIRDVVNWMNNRNEGLNQNKTVKQLILEYLNSTHPDPNWYGNANPTGFNNKDNK